MCAQPSPRCAAEVYSGDRIQPGITKFDIAVRLTMRFAQALKNVSAVEEFGLNVLCCQREFPPVFGVVWLFATQIPPANRFPGLKYCSNVKMSFY